MRCLPNRHLFYFRLSIMHCVRQQFKHCHCNCYYCNHWQCERQRVCLRTWLRRLVVVELRIDGIMQHHLRSWEVQPRAWKRMCKLSHWQKLSCWLQHLLHV